MPKIAIIIPTYNRPEMLERAIGSVIAQTITDLEIIVVDDGSKHPASTPFFDPRICVHRHAMPRGAAAARNSGIRIASSEHIAFLDDDDTMAPDFAENMLHFMETHSGEIDFAWPILNVIDSTTNDSHLEQKQACLIRRTPPVPEASYKAVAYVRATGMIFRSAAIKEVKGFDESLPVSEDRELIFRMLNKQYGCGSVQIPLVNFYVHPNPRLSTSDNLLRQVKCDATIVKRYMGFIEQHPTLASRYLNLLARREREAGLFDQARLTLKLLLKIRPYDVRALRRLALWPLTGR